jgi:glycogen(starch) synthase
VRILHLTVEYPPIIHGGLGTAVGGLVQASADSGLDVAVLLVGHGGYAGYGHADAGTEDWAGTEGAVPVIEAHWDQAVEAAVDVARTWRPDLIHLHPFWLWPVARGIRDRLGIPIVYTVHSLDRAEYELGHGPPECLTQWDLQADAIADSDHVIALTESERRLIHDYCPESAGRVSVVGNGIADEPVASPRANADEPIILFSGRFVDRKGVRELLAAIPQTLHAAPNARFVLAGGQRHCTAEEMTRWWLPDNLQPHRDRVVFTGWLTPHQLRDWYRRADILVVPSWYEPFGMVILEGMLHGLAVAAADVGGPSEILSHEQPGLLYAPRDVTALSHSVTRLITEPSLRRRLAHTASQHVRSHWLWPSVLERIRGVYLDARAHVMLRTALPRLERAA